MDFQGKIFALCMGIAGTVAALLLLVLVTSTAQITKTSSAFSKAEQLTLVSQLSQSAGLSYQNQLLSWKNILLRGSVATQKPQYIRDFQSASAQTQRDLDLLRAELISLNQGGILEKLNQLIADHQSLTQRYAQAIETYDPSTFGGQQTADLFTRNTDINVTEQMTALNQDLQDYVNQSYQSQSNKSVSSVVIRNLTFVLFAVLISGILIFFMIRVVRDLFALLGDGPEKVLDITNHLAQGDLNQQITFKQPDSVLGALSMLQLKLKNTVQSLDTVGGDLKTLSLQLEKAPLIKEIDLQLERIAATSEGLKDYQPTPASAEFEGTQQD